MSDANLTHILWLLISIITEITANILLKYSDGFKRPVPSILSLLAVLVAFGALSQAVKGIDLAVAYALWGGFGVIATITAGFILFGQKINCKGWIGIILLVFGMILIKMS